MDNTKKFRYCPFNGKNCGPSCAVFISHSADKPADGHCGLIAPQKETAGKEDKQP